MSWLKVVAKDLILGVVEPVPGLPPKPPEPALPGEGWLSVVVSYTDLPVVQPEVVPKPPKPPEKPVPEKPVPEAALPWPAIAIVGGGILILAASIKK